MKKIGIIYSFKSNKTAKIAEKIFNEFGDLNIESVDAENLTDEKFLSFDNIIAGVPTWFDGELPNYWDEFVPAIEDFNLKGKKIAIFGLGDQKGYPENFNDGIGILAKIFQLQGAQIVGYTSLDGYKFEKSLAVCENRFCGLCLDQENQARMTKERIENWVKQLKEEFN